MERMGVIKEPAEMVRSSCYLHRNSHTIDTSQPCAAENLGYPQLLPPRILGFVGFLP